MTTTTRFSSPVPSRDFDAFPELLVRLEVESTKIAHHLLILGSFRERPIPGRAWGPYRLLLTSTLWDLETLCVRSSGLRRYADLLPRAAEDLLDRVAALAGEFAGLSDIECMVKSLGRRTEVVSLLVALRDLSREAKQLLRNGRPRPGSALELVRSVRSGSDESSYGLERA